MSTILTNTVMTQSDVAGRSWPITVSGGAYVSLGSSLVFLDASHCFIIGSNGTTIDGSGYTIDISGVVNYPGFVNNGVNGVNGYSNITIQNLGVITHGTTTLASDGGWIGQTYYSNNASGNIIQNCYSTGAISNSNSGGIVGSYAGELSGGNLLISNFSFISNFTPGSLTQSLPERF